MYFKLTSKNAYRDLVRNARRISISQLSESEKREAYQELYEVLKPRLGEMTYMLNAEAAYAQRITHWNERDVAVLKPVKTLRNPWLRFKREFVDAMHAKNPSRAVQIALAWFYQHPYRDDWVVT
tara:strand:+ start:518 stop:889 length:372 start_codon:yes stop_codon:yes gene_type:complete